MKRSYDSDEESEAPEKIASKAKYVMDGKTRIDCKIISSEISIEINFEDLLIEAEEDKVCSVQGSVGVKILTLFLISH